ncbi:hypothetical protein BLNAU_13690 [Blattamonas nauphoetae]|uniref:Protein kinase domain-containing protein n=1 Tax=Blattamonas nauphoetae TaxID=2049346 RepID=A0ABQ9XIY8_9EUKA|nr:hypothetical protein BLNAU_13690 [Blattamonas nauphoetae]
MFSYWVDREQMLFFLTWASILTQALHDLQLPDLGETISSHSRVSNREESPQTIFLQHPRYQSRTVEISSEIIDINGTAQSRPTIFENEQVKGTLLRLVNSTASFANLAFQPLTARILTVTDHSECTVSNSVISVIKDVSPIECSDSTVQVVTSEFDFTSTQNHSPSLSTTASLSSAVSFHSCSFSDVVVTSPGSFISCSCVQTSQTDHCQFSNISHCPTFLQSAFSPLFHNVSVLNTHFSDCENVLFGGVVRDTEDRTSLLAANTSFTRSRSTYTNRTGEQIGPTIDKTGQVVNVDHRYQQCTFENCTSLDAHGGGIRCESGANLIVDNCTFLRCRSPRTPGAYPRDGGGIFVSNTNGGYRASVTRSIFSKCEAIYGGGIRVIWPSYLVIQYCNTTECYATDVILDNSVGPWGGGIGLTGMPIGAILSNIRFEDCKARSTASCLDNNNAAGSITYSNLLFAHGECKEGNVIFSSVTDNAAEIAFFSCTFFSNVANGSRQGTVEGTTKTMAIGNDIRFYNNSVWERILKDKSSFVNCFSTSAFPRIVLSLTPLVVDFSAFTGGNDTLLDIHLPTPGVVVSTEAGKDLPGCGSDSHPKCHSIGFTGRDRLANAFTSVLVEGGRYEETISFNVAEKPAAFSSNGDEHPVVSFAPQHGEDRFMELGVGTLSLSLFTFVPCETASIVKVVGAGPLTIESCEFQNEGELIPIVQTSIIKMSEGTALLKNVKFVGIEFNQGSIVRCEGHVTKLEIQHSVFTGLRGTTGPLISFERLSEGGELIVNKAKLHGNAVSDCVGGITTNNVTTVTITSTTFAHLTDRTQKAALSISTCTTALTLSDLIFEDCSGSDASSLHVISSLTLANPIPNSLSTTNAPISSVESDTTTVFIPKPNALTIDPSLGSAGVFCWKESTGCVSLSCLEPRIGKGHTWPISAAAGTSLESSVSLEEKTLIVSGNGKSSTTFQHSGGIDSPLIVQASGSLTVSDVHFSILPAQATTTRSASFFSISGGTLSLTSVSFNSMSFSSSNSLIKLTGASSITLDTIDFSGMATEGSGSVLHSTSTGTIAFSSISFSSCNCGASQKGRSVFIEQSFVADCVSMTSVQVSSAGTVGQHDIFLKGTNVESTVTESWESLIGAEDTLTSAVMGRVVGEEKDSVVKSGPLAYLRYPYTEGSMHVDGSFWDHESCGKEKLPCETFKNVHFKLNTSNQKVVFLSPYTLTGEINSLALGSVLTTKLAQTVSSDQTTQFVIQAGPLSFEDITILLPTAITKPLFVVKANVLSIASTVTIQNPPSASTHQAPLFSLASGSLQMTGTQVIFQPIYISTKSLIEQTKGSLTISNMNFENISRTAGDGSVISATLSTNSDELSIESTAFKLCSCSAGNGGALFVSLSASALFSITGASSFTSCTASGNGNSLYLSRPDLISFLTPNEGTGPLDSIKPTLSSKAAADAALNEFYGFESSSSEGSLLLYWYPFSTLDTTMHVHSSGHTHSLCGKEALPCQTLPDSLNKIQSATTLMIDSSIELSTKLTSLPRAWTFTKSGSFVLTLSEAGQLEVSNSGSALTLSSLPIEVGTLTVDRTAELLTVSAGSLVVSSCTVFASTKSLSVSFISFLNGQLSFTGSTMTVPTLASKPFVSVTGGKLDVDSSTSFINSDTAIHQASLLSIGGGEVVLDGTQLTTAQRMTFASSSLIVQTKGSLTISNMKIENITRTTGDGSVLHSTLSSTTDKIQISGTSSFTDCRSAVGNGGVLFISCPPSFPSSSLVVDATFSDCSCGPAMKGEWVFVEGHTFKTILSPDYWTKTIAGLTWDSPNTLWGTDTNEEENSAYRSISLLYDLVPYRQRTIHVGTGGRNENGCGSSTWKCLTLNQAHTHLSGSTPFTLSIDTEASHSDGLAISSETTIKGDPATSKLLVGATGSLSVSASTLSLSTFVLDGSSVSRSSSLLVLSQTGSIDINHCTFTGFKCTTDGAVFSSTLGTANSVTIANSAFTSCTSAGNGGVLAITLNGGSITITDANVTFSSCDGLNGKNVYLAGEDLATTLAKGGLNGIKPSIPENGIYGDEEKSKWFGSNTGSDASSGSLLYYWFTHTINEPSTHVHSSGTDHPLCGVQALPCLKLSHALTNTNSAAKFILDSKHSLNEDVTIANTATITSNTVGLAVDVQSDGCFSIAAYTLSVESLSFTTTVPSFDRSLFTITNIGSLALSGSTFTGFSSTVAGSVVSGTVSTSVLIEHCTLSHCNSTEIGGIVSISLTGSGTISISDNTFTTCTSSKNEGNLGSISSSDLIAFLKTNHLSSIKPSLPTNTGLFGNEEKSKWFGMDTETGTTGSLLFYWYPHLDTEASTHVHSNGDAHNLCGSTALPCSILSSAIQKTTAEKKTIIDSAFLLNETISAVFGAHTLTSASPLNTVTIGGDATIALTSNSLTLQSISFTQSAQVQTLTHPLISVTTAPITIDRCTFSKFTLADSALIKHAGSNLSLSEGSFKGITRRQGEGAVLASTIKDGMQLHVDGVTLDTLASETGLATGLLISFLALTNPTHNTPFSLTNLIFKQPSSSNADSSHFVCIVGNNFSAWIDTGDPRFAGSYESLASDNWLWSVDEQTELSGSVVFYLKEGTGPVGVSDAGYLISKCGFFSVWCGEMEYGLSIADSKNQVQINIHDTVTVDKLIDLNEEYRIHGKLSSSVIVLTQKGGFVIDSGEEVIFDGMTLKVAGNADRSALEVLDGHFHVKNARVVVNTAAVLPFLLCQDSQLTFESIVMDKLAPTSQHDVPAVSQTLIKLERAKMSFVDITFESELPDQSTFLEISNGTTELSKLHLSPTIKTVGNLVSMNGGSFSLVDLTLNAVAITSPSFVFSEVASCTITNLTASELSSTELIQIDSSDSFTLQSCTFSGASDKSTQLNEDTLCSWSTGLISINSTPTTIRASEFKKLGQGALSVNGSRVSVTTSAFIINSAGSSDFPSVHRNIRCKDGNVSFEDLNGGDGVNNTSLWILGENCEIRLKEEKVTSPFFQPAFDAEKSSSKQEKNKTLTVTLVAGLLVPCGLQIELFESSKESDHTSSFLKALTPSSTTSFTEEKVILSLSPTEIHSKLNASAEWKGRIVTGNEQRSSSFLVKQSLSDERKSHAVQAMKWVIPVVCAVLALLFILILLIVLCRRRRQKKAAETQGREELNEVQDEKIEVLNDDLLYPATSLVNAVPSQAPFDKEDPSVKRTAFQPHHESLLPDSKSFSNVEVVKAEEGVQVAQINKRDTLYNRLHSNQKQPISKGMTAQQIVRALMKLYNINSALELFTRFSSHVVLFDKEGQVYLDMNASNPDQSAVPLIQQPQIAQTQPGTDSNMTRTTPSNQREGFEMMRWRAPETVVEQGEEKKEVKPDQAAVFSLGLVLYEIETGCVPFGEMDAVNASRQLRTGCLPKMELVGSEELSTLIAECLSLDGKNRPKLNSLDSRIASISFKADDAPNLLEFV